MSISLDSVITSLAFAVLGTGANMAFGRHGFIILSLLAITFLIIFREELLRTKIFGGSRECIMYQTEVY
jgi:hypothetical protein